MKRGLAVVALATLISAPAAAQNWYITGTGKAPTSPHSLQLKNAAIGQSITVPNVQNIRSMQVRFWFNGSPLGNTYYWTSLLLALDLPDLDNAVESTSLDQSNRGWVSWNVKRPFLPAQQLFLYFVSDYSDPYYDACFLSSCPSAGAGVPTEAFTRITAGTAYANGTLLEPEAVPENDLAFRVQFTTTPEPQTWVMLGTGVIAIAGLQLRRRKRAG